MRYVFRDLSFDAPDVLDDQSMIVLVDGDRAALTVAREPEDGPLRGYVDAVVMELDASMSSYRLETREDRLVGGKSAVLLVQTALSPEGRPVRQRQAYIDMGGSVLVVTATSPTEASEHGKALFERVIATLKVA